MAVYAGRAVFPAPFTDGYGTALPGLPVTIYTRATKVKPAAALGPFADRTKAVAVSNPTTTDTLGNAWPNMVPGDYDAWIDDGSEDGLTLPFTSMLDPGELAALASVYAPLALDGGTAAGTGESLIDGGGA